MFLNVSHKKSDNEKRYNESYKHTNKVRTIEGIDYKLAAYIGLFQLIAAIFPGTSRSGATIVGALILGVSRTVAAEYTFFLAVPVMFGASLLKGGFYADLYNSQFEEAEAS